MSMRTLLLAALTLAACAKPAPPNPDDLYWVRSGDVYEGHMHGTVFARFIARGGQPAQCFMGRDGTIGGALCLGPGDVERYTRAGRKAAGR
jgi:hypothetical protein